MYGVLCFALIKHISLGRYTDKKLYKELTSTLDTNCSSVFKEIEKTISHSVEYDRKNRLEQYNGSLYSKRVYYQSLKAIDLIDSLRESVETSDKTKAVYMDDSTLNKLSHTVSSFLDSSVRIISERDWYEYQKEIYRTFWDNLLYDKDWAKHLFKTQCKEEVIALLTSIKLNILITTNYAVKAAYNNHTFRGCILDFDENQAIVFPTKPYTFIGEPVLISAGIAYYNKAINPDITNNTGKIIQIENGVATLITTPKYAGTYKLYGTATLDFKDSIHSLPWQTQYYVAPKGIYMHIDNANKCYAGIPFNMTIGLEEYSADKLSLRSKDAVIKKLNDNTYTITAHKGVKSFMVYMDAINADGSMSTSVAAKHIIVLQPMPEITLGAIRNGVIGKEYIVENPILNARPRNEELDIAYNIKQYDISYIKANNQYIEPVTVHGNKLYNTESLQIGDRIFITDIIAIDNYGNTHHVPAMSFKITL